MNDVLFPEPIVLTFQSVSERKVTSSWEAMECLDQQWPEWARGPSWRAAYRVCRDALDGWRSATDARKTFRKAAKQAGLLPSQRCLTRPLRDGARPVGVVHRRRP
jgi:hypothetical protein